MHEVHHTETCLNESYGEPANEQLNALGILVGQSDLHARKGEDAEIDDQVCFEAILAGCGCGHRFLSALLHTSERHSKGRPWGPRTSRPDPRSASTTTRFPDHPPGSAHAYSRSQQRSAQSHHRGRG